MSWENILKEEYDPYLEDRLRRIADVMEKGYTKNTPTVLTQPDLMEFKNLLRKMEKLFGIQEELQ